MNGIGKGTAAALIALMPELGSMNRHQVDSLGGLAPHPNESGTFKGQRRIRGGRPEVRAVLFMPALRAAAGKGEFAAFYKRLVSSPSMIAEVTSSSALAASAIGASCLVQPWPLRVKTRTRPASTAIWQRQPSNFTSVDQPSPFGGLSTRVGVVGAINPAGRRRHLGVVARFMHSWTG
jgi:hypothetical protein